MKKQTVIYLSILLLTIATLLIANDVWAQSAAEDEIIRVTERVLDVVLNFFKSILNLIADFLKDLIPFFGDDSSQTVVEQTNS